MRPKLPQNANFLGLDPHLSDPETARVVLLTAPFEQTSSFGKGSGAGPGAILEASRQVELFDARLGFETCEKVSGIATLEPILSEQAGHLCTELETETMSWLKQGKFVVTLGGEHTAVIGAVKAHSRFFGALTVVQIDAHSDLRDEYQDNPWSHACAASRIRDFHSDIVQVGIRSQAKEERIVADTSAIPVFYAHDIHSDDRSGSDWITSILDTCKENVYVTLDCDAFDPSVIPSTGTPEPGGLTWDQMNRLLERLVHSRRLVGFDVSELSPVTNLHFPQFTIAKLIYRILGLIAGK
jgi:agmatinase